MNQEQYCRSDDKMACLFHPAEMVTGICALCLNEKLSVLAAQQELLLHQTLKKSKVFALTTTLRNLLEIKHHKPNDHNSHTSSSTSPEDSFISIKFEDNGVASWDKGKISEMPLDASWDKPEKIKSAVGHAKPRAPMRWRRRIGHLFQLDRWKRSSGKGNTCSMGVKLKRTKS